MDKQDKLRMIIKVSRKKRDNAGYLHEYMRYNNMLLRAYNGLRLESNTVKMEHNPLIKEEEENNWGMIKLES